MTCLIKTKELEFGTILMHLSVSLNLRIWNDNSINVISNEFHLDKHKLQPHLVLLLQTTLFC